jgi:hypothetical protein
MHPLRALLEEAAGGRFPPPDGGVRVLPAPPGRSNAVVAFTAHHVIAVDVEPDETLAHLPSPDLGAPVNAKFLAWLGSRLGSPPGSLDVVLGAPVSWAQAPTRCFVRPGRGHTTGWIEPSDTGRACPARSSPATVWIGRQRTLCVDHLKGSRSAHAFTASLLGSAGWE